MARTSVPLAQHFLKDRRLAAAIVREANLSRRDTVVEIGPGTGTLTRELARSCRRVVAVELDAALCAHLRTTLSGLTNVEIRQRDFLRYRIRERRYKILSSLPFSRTSDIVRKMLGARNPPESAHVIVQEEAAWRLTGERGQRCLSLMLRPWFSFRAGRRLRRSDFSPPPRVDSVLLHILKRPDPLVDRTQRRAYEAFTAYTFCKPGGSLRQRLDDVFSARQWRRLARDLSFDPQLSPRDVKMEVWVRLFEFYVTAASLSQVVPPPELADSVFRALRGDAPQAGSY